MKIYIISGKMHVGKDTIANMIVKNINKKSIKVSYAFYLKEYAKNICNWDGSDKTKPRAFLQTLGDKIKKDIDPKFLINRIIEDIKVYSAFFDVIIITDARFKDEIDDIRNNFNNTTVIRIKREYNNDTHISETDLDNYSNYDYVIDNNGTLDELENKIKKIISEVEHV